MTHSCRFADQVRGHLISRKDLSHMPAIHSAVGLLAPAILTSFLLTRTRLGAWRGSTKTRRRSTTFPASNLTRDLNQECKRSQSRIRSDATRLR